MVFLSWLQLLSILYFFGLVGLVQKIHILFLIVFLRYTPSLLPFLCNSFGISFSFVLLHLFPTSISSSFLLIDFIFSISCLGYFVTFSFLFKLLLIYFCFWWGVVPSEDPHIKIKLPLFTCVFYFSFVTYFNKFMHVSCSSFRLHLYLTDLQFPLYYWLPWYNCLWISRLFSIRSSYLMHSDSLLTILYSSMFPFSFHWDFIL